MILNHNKIDLSSIFLGRLLKMNKKRLQIILWLNFEIIHKIGERTIEIFYG